MKINLLIVICAFFFVEASNLFAQVTGEPSVPAKKDTTFIFKPARPLKTFYELQKEQNNIWGLEILLSNSGFGFGTFYEYALNENLSLTSNLFVSGARNTDETEYYFPELQEYRVPNKINRLYLIPITLGLQQYIFSNELSENFKPYIDAGLGTGLILQTPYSHEFFESFSYMKTHVKFAGYIGVGTWFNLKTAVTGLNIKYYYIPFSSKGLESVINHPIKDFGGLFITLTIGKRY